MATYQPLYITTVEAQEDIPKQRFVDMAGNIAGAGEKALGVSDAKSAAGEECPVGVLGILLVEAGGTVTQYGEVESDANGKAVDITTGKSNGWALDAASAAGTIICIVRGI